MPDKPLPQPPASKTLDNKQEWNDDEFEFFHKFSREKVKGPVHLITAALKERGAHVEYLMIPFRPEQTNEKLLKFLNLMFPMGNGNPVSERNQMKIIAKSEITTLFQSLKYIWCRLPHGEVVGWKSYMQFRSKEKEQGYPTKSFLEIMPQCLASPNQASIVYDFFDLIISISLQSKVNKMSARKIARMCGLWAFGKEKLQYELQDYAFDSIPPSKGLTNNSIQEGLKQWLPGSDAMFHLLLAFAKSFLNKDLEHSKLPRSLRNLLLNNSYPPSQDLVYKSETLLTVPLVTLKTDKFSKKPWELLERCNQLLDFENYNGFEAREDYALLKSLFKKKNNIEGISRKMSGESKRLMKLMSTKHSTFQAGWAPRRCLENTLHLEEAIEVSRIDIDDYFIWTWLSTLSYEQTSDKRKLFGRSLILEFEFDGFKKWVVFQECDITVEHNKDDQLKHKLAKKMEPERKKLQDKVKSSVAQDHRETENVTINSDFTKSTLNSPQPKEDPVDLSGQLYHTVISRENLQGKSHSKIHSLEQKISKWNPLSNLKKKSLANLREGAERSPPPMSSTDSSFKPISQPGSNMHSKEANSSNKSSNNSQKNSNSEVLHRSRHLSQYILPDIPKDEEGFKIDIPILENTSLDFDEPDVTTEYSETQSPVSFMLDRPQISKPLVNDRIIPTENGNAADENNRADLAIHELNDMMNDLLTEKTDKTELSKDNDAVSTEQEETFHTLTKFEQYKSLEINEEDFGISQTSLVPSLRIKDESSNSPVSPSNSRRILPPDTTTTLPHDLNVESRTSDYGKDSFDGDYQQMAVPVSQPEISSPVNTRVDVRPPSVTPSLQIRHTNPERHKDNTSTIVPSLPYGRPAHTTNTGIGSDSAGNLTTSSSPIATRGKMDSSSTPLPAYNGWTQESYKLGAKHGSSSPGYPPTIRGDFANKVAINYNQNANLSSNYEKDPANDQLYRPHISNETESTGRSNISLPENGGQSPQFYTPTTSPSLSHQNLRKNPKLNNNFNPHGILKEGRQPMSAIALVGPELEAPRQPQMHPNLLANMSDQRGMLTSPVSSTNVAHKRALQYQQPKVSNDGVMNTGYPNYQGQQKFMPHNPSAYGTTTFPSNNIYDMRPPASVGNQISQSRLHGIAKGNFNNSNPQYYYNTMHSMPQQQNYNHAHHNVVSVPGQTIPPHFSDKNYPPQHIRSPTLMTPSGSYMPGTYYPDAHVGNKLHSGNIYKKKEQKNLYKNIRSGNFGI